MGEEILRIPELIAHPEANEELARVFNKKVICGLKETASCDHPGGPVFSGSYQVVIEGKPRWFKVVPTIWDSDEEIPYIPGRSENSLISMRNRWNSLI